jgi:hypothetical protein
MTLSVDAKYEVEAIVMKAKRIDLPSPGNELTILLWHRGVAS